MENPDRACENKEPEISDPTSNTLTGGDEDLSKALSSCLEVDDEGVPKSIECGLGRLHVSHGSLLSKPILSSPQSENLSSAAGGYGLRKTHVKQSRKTILHKAKLILPNEYRGRSVVKRSSKWRTNTKRKTCSPSQHTDALPPAEPFQGECSGCERAPGPRQKMCPSACGTEHRRASFSSDGADMRSICAMDESSPEELAAYLEQMLYIPKPMSSMAEMMYT